LGRKASQKEVKVIEVVAAVIQRNDGAVLLAQRPPGKVYAGYWEFPGGKVEAGESPEHALARELHEELGIAVERAYPWITRVFTYPHGTVRLNFFRVVAWRNEPHPREQQAIAWQRQSAETVSPMLPANAPVLSALALPVEYAITNAFSYGTARMLEMLEKRLEEGLRLLQVREPNLTEKERRFFTEQAVGLAHRYGCRVLTKSPFAGAHGVHFTATELMKLTERPLNMLAAASCHSREELEHAMRLEVDFVVVGPVKATATHPQGSCLDWHRFTDLVRGTAIPVYAIGGLQPVDMQSAWRAGAHGVAMIRGSWS
jgi:8-oxo-dGTP diphosphatase